MVRPVIVNQGKVVRPSQLIASVGRTSEDRVCRRLPCRRNGLPPRDELS